MDVQHQHNIGHQRFVNQRKHIAIHHAILQMLAMIMFILIAFQINVYVIQQCIGLHHRYHV